MADQLYLSYRIRGYHSINMLQIWEKALRLFPYSKLSQSVTTLEIQAVSWEEPRLREQAFPAPVVVDDVLTVAGEAFHDDCAYVLSAWWDIWQYDTDWSVQPARVALCCFGPAFESEQEEHLRFEFGPDALFLPMPGVERSAFLAQSNLKSLLHFAHQLDDALDVEQRRLWTDTGENFAERLQSVLN